MTPGNQSPIFAALYAATGQKPPPVAPPAVAARPAARPPVVPVEAPVECDAEEAQLAAAAKAEVLTRKQKAVIEMIIADLRSSKATISLMVEADIPSRILGALRSAEIYAGSAVAELRSTFFNYTPDPK